MKKLRSLFFVGLLYVGCVHSPALCLHAASVVEGEFISGVVQHLDKTLAAGVKVVLLNARQNVIATATTDSAGKFTFANIQPGTYEVSALGTGFLRARAAVQVFPGSTPVCDLILESSPLLDVVTVSADVGQVQDKDQLGQQVNVISQEQIQERATTLVNQAVQEEVGVAVQTTSTVMGGIFIRGLTGKNVVIFQDGVRYSNSAQRGGVNTFLNLIEPSSLRAIEILRGPNSTQYGSDSLGGSAQFVTQSAPFAANGYDFHVQTSTFFSSASLAFGNSTQFTLGGRNFGLLVNLAGRRTNTLRPGGGYDSHAAVTRFLGLPSSIINGDRLPDTAVTEYGGNVKFNWAFAPGNQVTVNYERSQQDGGNRYDQLLGGDGNNIARLRNLMLDFGYVRYDTQRMPWFDNFSLGFSFNQQREERVNQGGNGNPRGNITSQYERTRTYGVQLYANKLLPHRHNLVLGADYYHDRITAPAFTINFTNGTVGPSRPRVPSNARYENYGFYAQDVWEAIPERLRFSGSVRYGAASYEARAQDSPLVRGNRLWPSDSLRADQVTFRASAIVNLTKELALAGNFSRGFRAPHMTDLGTLGLTGDGFEIAAPDVAGLGGLIGTTANSRAVSSGRPVEQVKAEISKNYELSLRYRNSRIDTDVTAFLTDIDDNLTKQALILPQGAVGKFLGGERIVSQGPTGVVFTALSPSPVLVRSNFDDARLWGLEYTLNAKLSKNWNLRGNFTYIHAKDKRTGLAPNIEGGTPPANGNLALRYNPQGKRWWAEIYTAAAYRQDRLSSLDLGDRRTGGNRSRSSIRNFFLNGATFRGLVAAGQDGRFGTADDVLRATGETLTQVTSRVLGNAEEAPLRTSVAGFATLNVRGGFRFSERQELFLAVENITDKNYRGISWGIDAPGVGVTARYTVRF